MAHKLITETFRTSFKVVDKETLRWFPGHMDKGLKQMQQKLKHIDCVIEVHDARIPFSGKNDEFKFTVSGVKPHVLVLNKIDLIDTRLIPRIQKQIRSDYENVIFTNCKDHMCNGVKRLFPLVQELINKSLRYNRADAEDYCIMIIGVPNVGKSSLINSLRNKYLGKAKATAVGPIAGVTRSVLHKIKMSENPLFYMLDTPGILTPKINNNETGLKLALCATLQDHLVGETTIADYLLYNLNKYKHFEYVNRFHLPQASDNIVQVLVDIAKSENKFLKLKDHSSTYVIKPDLKSAAQIMIKAFRMGELGKIMLDLDLLVAK